MPDELVDYITNERTHHVMPEEIDLVENPKEYYKDLKARKDAKGKLFLTCFYYTSNITHICLIDNGS